MLQLRGKNAYNFAKQFFLCNRLNTINSSTVYLVRDDVSLSAIFAETKTIKNVYVDESFWGLR